MPKGSHYKAGSERPQKQDEVPTAPEIPLLPLLQNGAVALAPRVWMVN